VSLAHGRPAGQPVEVLAKRCFDGSLSLRKPSVEGSIILFFLRQRLNHLAPYLLAALAGAKCHPVSALIVDQALTRKAETEFFWHPEALPTGTGYEIQLEAEL
jgi:hypothetical protein